MFIIPALAIGGGIGFILWGAKMIFDKNDSADEVIGTFLKGVPNHIRNYIQSVEISPEGYLKVNFNKETPKEIEQELENNLSACQIVKR